LSTSKLRLVNMLIGLTMH